VTDATDNYYAVVKRMYAAETFIEELRQACERMRTAPAPPEGETEYHKGYQAAAGNLLSRIRKTRG